MFRPSKKYESAGSGPGRRFPVGGTRPNTGPRCDEYPDLHRKPEGPKSS
ncbi:MULTISPECIES: hypothetical protein [unclassified Streptomyces]